ncbi:MAG: heme exporter protein CcmB, partial [Nannocystaceae bacterium]
MTVLRQTWILARNDLRQELRELELLITSVFFTVVILALYAVSFAEMSRSAQLKAVPGMLWIALAFVGALTLTRVFEREREADTFAALLAAPVHRVAIYGAKFLVTVLVLCVCAAVLVPGLLLVFPNSGVEGWSVGAMFANVLLGCAGFAAVGTVFAAGLAQGGGKNVLLSVVLYPLTTPVLMMSLMATHRVLHLHPGAWDILAKMAAL